ncbi:MAG: tetratricopeptide repeat protein [Hydrococcus sp. CSU_1_8]|nr:tetratricopeptide repeat protein [Hydrococcus sp. CSU_1_8]
MDKNLTHPEIATNLSNAAFTLAQTNNFLFLGYSKAEAGDYQGAIADYNQAIAVDPICIDAYLKRANAYLELEEYQAAIAIILVSLCNSIAIMLMLTFCVA